jgi:hypothetical protein
MSALTDYLLRDWELLVGREHGPLAFRMVLQPLVAAALAMRAGLRDARTGRPPFGWAVASDRARRRDLVREGWADIGRLFAVAIIVDAIYQIIVFHWVHVLQALVVAALLAIPSYVLMRGLTNRIASRLGVGPGSRGS